MTSTRRSLLRLGRLAPLLAALALAGSPALADNVATSPIVGTTGGTSYNKPAWWSNATMGDWNGKAARYNDASDRIAYETFRTDDAFKGGSLWRDEVTSDTSRKSTNGAELWLFSADLDPFNPPTLPNDVVSGALGLGQGTDVGGIDGTTVVFVADADGADPQCLGCEEVSGANGYTILKVDPSTNGTAASFTDVSNVSAERIRIRQNKDMAAWHPSGDWLVVAVEMPVHAGFKNAGNGEVGMFTNIYAVYVHEGADFGKIWVKLTDWVATWGSLYDNVSIMPYDSVDHYPFPDTWSNTRCPAGNQYGDSTSHVPYAYFHCSASGAVPPTSGVMRPTVAPAALGNGNARIAWGARVGVAVVGQTLPGGGVQLLGTGELKTVDVNIAGYPASRPDAPAIVNYAVLGPTEAIPGGVNTWKGKAYLPGNGNTPLLAQWYEAWDYSYDSGNNYLLIASDAFLTYRPGASPAPTAVDGRTFLYMDVTQWKVDGTQFATLTDYNPSAASTNNYDYPEGSATFPYAYTKNWGYWEEPSVYVYDTESTRTFLAFGANSGVLNAAGTKGLYNIVQHSATFALDAWLLDLANFNKNKEITDINTGGSATRFYYPTDYAIASRILYLTDVPAGGAGGSNPPGLVRTMDLGSALDGGLLP
ncbi:MAG: hypothetical protein H6923_01335 [Alphaproteobacteria bacterium]|nr:hypothetical protein [Alphaproteobacteria bacterium]